MTTVAAVLSTWLALALPVALVLGPMFRSTADLVVAVPTTPPDRGSASRPDGPGSPVTAKLLAAAPITLQN